MWIALQNDMWEGVQEIISQDFPEIEFYAGVVSNEYFFYISESAVVVPKGTIQRLIGKDMVLGDEPIEIREYNEQK